MPWALALREALRDVLAAHSGLPVDERSLQVVNAASAAAPVAVVIDAHCASALRPAARGFDGAIGRLFAIIARADADGTWCATQGLHGGELSLGVLRPLAQPIVVVVQHGGVRQPREGTRLPRAPRVALSEPDRKRSGAPPR